MKLIEENVKIFQYVCFYFNGKNKPSFLACRSINGFWFFYDKDLVNTPLTSYWCARLLAGLPFVVYPIFSAIDLFGIYQGLKHVHLQTLTKVGFSVVLHYFSEFICIPLNGWSSRFFFSSHPQSTHSHW